MDTRPEHSSSDPASDSRGADLPEAGPSGIRIPDRLKTAILVALPLLFAVLAFTILSQNTELTPRKKGVGVTVAVSFSLMLASFPLFISYSQTIARQRQWARLSNLRYSPVAKTTHYKIAREAIRRLKPFSLDDDYFMPMITFEAVLIAGCLSVLLATFVDHIFEVPSFLLGGTEAIPGRLDPEHSGLSAAELNDMANYQRGTFLAIVMAFFGSYVYMLYKVLDRVNNNDIYPISYYYLTARIFIACIVAIVFRHVAGMFEIGNSGGAIVLIGFVAGFAPDLFIVAMSRKVFLWLKVIGGQPDPARGQLPTNMNLFMIEGLTGDKIDRLKELGIDSAQTLALQNPIMLWTRLPYDLSLLVDWMAQAQLYLWAKEEKTKALRNISVNCIFDLRTCLANRGAHAELARALDVSKSIMPAYGENLDKTPAFKRLQEVRDALTETEADAAGSS